MNPAAAAAAAIRRLATRFCKLSSGEGGGTGVEPSRPPRSLSLSLVPLNLKLNPGMLETVFLSPVGPWYLDGNSEHVTCVHEGK